MHRLHKPELQSQALFLLRADLLKSVCFWSLNTYWLESDGIPRALEESCELRGLAGVTVDKLDFQGCHYSSEEIFQRALESYLNMSRARALPMAAF